MKREPSIGDRTPNVADEQRFRRHFLVIVAIVLVAFFLAMTRG